MNLVGYNCFFGKLQLHDMGRQRRGESLNDLNLKELHDLEQEMEVAVKAIRDSKV
jgi:hypothetical protein